MAMTKKEKSDLGKCQHQIWSSNGSWRGGYKQCKSNAKVERDGKAYCLTHDPVLRKEKQDARDKASNDRWNAAGKKKVFDHKAGSACHGVDVEHLRPGMLKELIEAAGVFLGRYHNHIVNADLLFSDVAEAMGKALGDLADKFAIEKAKQEKGKKS
jgi:hypothetical protein